MPARKNNAPSDATSALSFEDAMTELESIVDAMEGEQLPLEELVARYEVGSALLKHCVTVLTAAKKRIQLITLADSEETDPQDGGEPAEIPENKLKQGSDDPDDSNDISLF